MNPIELTDEQYAAVRAPHDRGRVVVVAGAGTGKTRVLAERAVHLVTRGAIAPRELLVVTFTRKAAAEIGDRILHALDRSGLGTDETPSCSTVHALAARVVRAGAYRAGYPIAPRQIGGARAIRIFAQIFDAALRGALDADLGALPIVELGLERLRDALGSVAVRLRALGIAPETFEERALAAAEALAAQSWGQVWTRGTRSARTERQPRNERTPEERAREAEAERRNARAVAAMLRAFDERLRRDGLITYGELPIVAARMLRSDASLRDELAATWRYVLMDEFQDTDARQLDFLRELLGGEDDPFERMTVVGDPRQSIYAFNGADPRLIAEWEQRAAHRYALTHNHRSYQAILDLAQQVLEASGEEAGTQPLRAARGVGCETEPPVVYGEFGGQDVALRDAITAEATAIADEIASLLASGMRPGEIAVLLRKRTHLDAYAAALEACKIPIVADRGGGILDTPSLRDARAWIALLCGDRRPEVVVRLLQSPAYGLSDAATAEIATYARDGARSGADDRTAAWYAVVFGGVADDRLAREIVERLLRLREDHRVLESCANLEPREAIRRLCARIPVADDARRALLALANRCVAEEPAATLRSFATWLESGAPDDEAQAEPPESGDAVVLTTVHQAKGLEWPAVFVAGITKRQYSDESERDAVRYDERSGALVMGRDLEGRKTLRSIMSSKPYDPATGERIGGDSPSPSDGEHLRILHVAMTRARDRLYLTVPIAKNGGAFEPLARIRDRCAPWPSRGAAASRTPAADGSAVSAPAAAAPASAYGDRAVGNVSAGTSDASRTAERPARLLIAELREYVRCPLRAWYRYELELPPLAGERPIPPRGSAVHRALERWVRARLTGSPIEAEAAASVACDEFEIAEVGERGIVATLTANATRELENLEMLDAEVPLVMTVEGRILYGVADLVARDGASLVVVDYKTGADTGDLREAEVVQLECYRRAVAARFPAASVRARILRIRADGCTWVELTNEEMEAADHIIREAARGRSREPQPRDGCSDCPYRDDPCDAWR